MAAPSGAGSCGGADSPIAQLTSPALDPLNDARIELFPQHLQHLLPSNPIGGAPAAGPPSADAGRQQLGGGPAGGVFIDGGSLTSSLFGPTFEQQQPAALLSMQAQLFLLQAAFGHQLPLAASLAGGYAQGLGAVPNHLDLQHLASAQHSPQPAAPAHTTTTATASWVSAVTQGSTSAPPIPRHGHAAGAAAQQAPCARRDLFGGQHAALPGGSPPPLRTRSAHAGQPGVNGGGSGMTPPGTPGSGNPWQQQAGAGAPTAACGLDPFAAPFCMQSGGQAQDALAGCFWEWDTPGLASGACGLGMHASGSSPRLTPEQPAMCNIGSPLLPSQRSFDIAAGVATLLLESKPAELSGSPPMPGVAGSVPSAHSPVPAPSAPASPCLVMSAPPLPGIRTTPAVAPRVSSSGSLSPPVTPVVAGAGISGAGRGSPGPGQFSRLRKCSSANSSTAGSTDSRRTSCAAGSRLGSTGGGHAAQRSSSAGGGGPGSAQPSAAAAAGTRRMWMEMHDSDCSAYCLSGALEPHKLWFGVGMHRAIRKLITNNKKRHSLILALHAAAEDPSGYGDLGLIYHAVTDLHASLAAAGWASEAGMKLCAGVEELLELMHAALRDGPGCDAYMPPAWLQKR